VDVVDVGDAIPDDRRKLEETVQAAAPDDAERRPELDSRVNLGARGRDAVHRPLKIRTPDPNSPDEVLAEVETPGFTPVSRCADPQPHALPRHFEPRDSVRPGERAMPGDSDERTLDGL
jgi:hypothetical protein